MARRIITAGRVFAYMRPMIETALSAAIERQAKAVTLAQWFEDQHTIDDCRRKLAILDPEEGK